jgi:DNA mismatch repair protein MutS
MRQWFRFKEQHPDCVLLFRMGDFYELFFDDAKLASRALGLTLTQRTGGVPLAGVPHHQLNTYLSRLVAQGYRVAIADQTQDPKDAKGVLERAITQVVTAGTLIDESLVEDAAAVRLGSVHFTAHGDDSPASAAVIDASTGDVVLLDASPSALADELAARAVREVLYAQTATGEAPPQIRRVLAALGIAGTGRPSWHFRRDEALQAVVDQYGVATLAGFGLGEDDPAVHAAGAALRYLRETKAVGDEAAAGRPGAFAAATLAHLRPPRREASQGRCLIDAVSLRSLEIERTLRDNTPEASLLGLFTGAGGRGGCRTAMGKRLVRDWLCRPSGVLEEIESRHARVAALVQDRRLAREFGAALEPIGDVARIAGRVALGRCSPRDIVALGRSAGQWLTLAELMDNAPAFAPALGRLRSTGAALTPLAQRIGRECRDDPPGHLREGGVFRPGVDPELDELRSLQTDGADWLAAYQARIAQELALPGIKVGFNKIFGYYVELSAAQAREAKPRLDSGELIRKQTLKNAERFITPELKRFEDKALRAEDGAIERERVLFTDLVAAAAATLGPLQAYAEAVAELDVLLAFADRAAAKSWCRPLMTDAATLLIDDGRHPVLEETLGPEVVPNGLALGASALGSVPALALITGPNMAGKSTFIRQVALITALAHAGSFVPAAAATVGLCDRIFTRVGADDALHRGQSTFMVEMIETANILNHATPRSLVILDEIGRGTSTLDGLSLAWAIAEALAGDADRPGPRTLFATHYHELTELESRLEGRVANLYVAVREWTPAGGESEIVFLHTVKPGRSDRSYGVQVARLAGVPAHITARAKDLLDTLAVQHGPSRAAAAKPTLRPAQLPLFTELLPHPAVDRLRGLDLDGISPRAALDMLHELRRLVDADGPPIV